MICETCHGKGMVTLYKPSQMTTTIPSSVRVTGLCPTCGGYGSYHCCDGECAQPEPKLITGEK